VRKGTLKRVRFVEESSLLENGRESADEEVLALSVDNPAYFELLVDRYEEAFLRKALSMLRRREDAEDVVQDTFVKIYLNAKRFKVQEGASFKSWAYKILINTSLTKAKRMSREWNRTVIDDDPEFMESLPDTNINKHEYKRLDIDEFLSIVSRLPVIFARLLKLSVLEGRSSEQIAKEEGVSVGAVRTRLHRAKKEFQKINSSMKNKN